MKKIYTFEAIKFGFVTFFKNPLFFLLAFMVSKLIWVTGLLIGFFLAMPFLSHFLRFAEKTYLKVLEVIPELNVKAIFAEGVKKAVTGGATNSGGIFGAVGGFFKGVANTGPLGMITQGVSGVAKGIGKALLEKLEELKEILNEVLAHKILFVYLFIGLFLFLLIARMTYDFIMIGWARFSLDFYDKGKSSLKYLLPRPSMLIKYMLATLLFFGISCIPSAAFLWLYLFISFFMPVSFPVAVIGYLIALVCSWYLMLRLWFYPYYLVDKQVGVLESLKQSYDLGIGFVSVAISLVGFGLILGIPLWISFSFPHVATFFILGIILAIVWMASWVSYAFLYKKLSTH